MDNTNPNQSVTGTNLQNTSQLQTGESTNGLQQQNTGSNYKQLQQDALGSEAYRNYDGLKVQDTAGTQQLITSTDPVQFKANQNSWPSVWVWVLAVGVFLVFINMKNNVKRRRAANDSGSGTSKGAQGTIAQTEAAATGEVIPGELIAESTAPSELAQKIAAAKKSTKAKSKKSNSSKVTSKKKKSKKKK